MRVPKYETKKETRQERIDKAFMEMTSGCPFNNFGPCQTVRCAFFVATNLYKGERECAIRASYLQLLIDGIILKTRALKQASTEEPLLAPSVPLEGRELVSALEHLNGIYAHPHTSPSLKEQIRKTKRFLRRALKDFLRED